MRHDWTLAEIREIYDTPLLSLLFRAQQVAREFHRPDEVQTCHLVSIKTGGCPEDCAYCPQSAHYDTPVSRHGLMDVDEVMARARRAADEGVTRLCMGAAWRDAPEGPEFDTVLRMVRGVAGLGLEVCCTLGMLTDDQARRLKEAGLAAYNHNLDTSPEFYGHDHHHSRLRRTAAHAGGRAPRRHHGVLRRDYRHGRVRRRSAGTAAAAGHGSARIPRACRSISCSGWPARRSPTRRRSTRWCSSACSRRRASSCRPRWSASRRAATSCRAKRRCCASWPARTRSSSATRLLTTSNPAPDTDRQLLSELGLTPMPRDSRARLTDTLTP